MVLLFGRLGLLMVTSVWVVPGALYDLPRWWYGGGVKQIRGLLGLDRRLVQAPPTRRGPCLVNEPGKQEPLFLLSQLRSGPRLHETTRIFASPV
ncbi:hypothetical protein JOL62DRAFT_72551 [Phyllosticta paracitricarpa]|uniref:Secreted protein n=1 Tax=Phyllosticta paracitricarpa TaxID=2016321 RepID=A0ABR1NB64_9PEZI